MKFQTAELDTNRTDEVGTLGVVLDRMLTRLKQAQAQVESQSGRLQSLNRELELRVAERTRELAGANAELGGRLDELKRTQEQLITADRHNSVGLLAAGVAHEINNPMAYVAANVRFVASALRSEDPLGPRVEELRQALEEASSGCDRVTEIVRSLKTFSRSDTSVSQRVDVTKAVEVAISMAANEIKHRARLVREFGEVEPVSGSDVQIAQVVLNLLINAAHAIAPGAADRNEIRVTLSPTAADEVRIRVSDTGSGMTPEVRARLFTPFFTTKPVGLGTGLGLSICHGIVSALGGRIEVESAEGAGSAFTVVLPASHQALPARRDERSPIAPGSSGLVLVVDDEPLVTAAVERMLRGKYQVLAAHSSQEALALVAERPFDAVLCDLMMPVMNGVEFERQLLVSNPSLARRLAFISGGAFTTETRAFLEANQHRLLEKPIDPESLSSMLRRLLDAGDHPAGGPK